MENKLQTGVPAILQSRRNQRAAALLHAVPSSWATERPDGLQPEAPYHRAHRSGWGCLAGGPSFKL